MKSLPITTKFKNFIRSFINSDEIKFPLYCAWQHCNSLEDLTKSVVFAEHSEYQSIFDEYKIPRDFALFLVYDSESMEPAIRNADKILIDTSKTTISSGSIYAICINNRIDIRKIEVLENNQYKLIPTNTKFNSIIVNVNDIVVIGKPEYCAGVVSLNHDIHVPVPLIESVAVDSDSIKYFNVSYCYLSCYLSDKIYIQNIALYYLNYDFLDVLPKDTYLLVDVGNKDIEAMKHCLVRVNDNILAKKVIKEDGKIILVDGNGSINFSEAQDSIQIIGRIFMILNDCEIEKFKYIKQ